MRIGVMQSLPKTKDKAKAVLELFEHGALFIGFNETENVEWDLLNDITDHLREKSNLNSDIFIAGVIKTEHPNDEGHFYFIDDGILHQVPSEYLAFHSKFDYSPYIKKEKHNENLLLMMAKDTHTIGLHKVYSKDVSPLDPAHIAFFDRFRAPGKPINIQELVADIGTSLRKDGVVVEPGFSKKKPMVYNTEGEAIGKDLGIMTLYDDNKYDHKTPLAWLI